MLRGVARVGFLGSYSIDNTGDVVIGAATRAAVRARVACDEVVLAPALPQALWRHDWSAARGLGVPIRPVAPGGDVHFADDLDALVIGGGGIVMPIPGFEPFLLGDPAAWGEVPAAWNAVGSQSTPWFAPELAGFYARVRGACARLRLVSVRNRTTETFLRRCGWDGPIEVVPDPAIGFAAPPDPAVDAALASLGLAGGRPLVGLSLGTSLLAARAAAFYDPLLAELERLAGAGEVEVVVFPFGGIYGDAEVARRAAARVPHARLLEVALGPVATWQLVGRLDLCVCARLHAAIAAYAQEVPFLVCDEYFSDQTASSKIRELVVERGLEPAYLCPFAGERPAWRLALALADPVVRPDALAADRAALDRHFDRLVAALGLTAPSA